MAEQEQITQAPEISGQPMEEIVGTSGSFHFEEAEEAAEGEPTPEVEPSSDVEPLESDEETTQPVEVSAEDSPKSGKYAELIRQQRELRREKEELARSQAQLSQYFEGIRSAVATPEGAAKLLESLGIDVNREVGRIARAKLGLEEEPEQVGDLSKQLLGEINNLKAQLQQVSQGYHEAGLRRTTERQISRALSSMADKTPFLTEAINEDPDLVDKIVDTAVKSQRAGRNVDIVQLLQESEAIVERDVKAAYSWSLKNPRLRSELRAMLAEDSQTEKPSRPSPGKISKDDKVSLASREPAAAQGDLTEEDLDRMALEEALGRA